MKTSIRNTLLATAASAVLTMGIWAPATAAEDQAQSAASKAMLTAQGARYWSNQCQRCHNLRDPGEFSDAEWDIAVTHMRVRANIPAKQIRAIKAFLKSSN